MGCATFSLASSEVYFPCAPFPILLYRRLKQKVRYQMMKHSFLHRISIFVVAPSLVAAFSSCSSEEPLKNPEQSSLLERWDEKNSPLQVMNPSYKTQWNSLPLKGQALWEPWSDSYWPHNFAGIAQRWNGYQGDHFTYPLASFEQVKRMSFKERARLSPAEKYDVLMGRFDYPFTSHERQRTSPSALSWEGLCDGWAPAAINYREPFPVVVKNPQGIEVPFGSSDIKALLTFLQATDESPKVRFLGSRCNEDLEKNPSAAHRRECRDVNAGAFHIVLTNEIGIGRKAFIIDKTRDLEVWNQPVYRYSSQIEREQKPSQGAAVGTVREILVQTEITYSIESVTLWSPVLGTEYHNYTTVSYRYRLELDAAGAILGGEWLGEERPDFLWTKDQSPMTGIYEPLKRLYQKSLEQASLGVKAMANPALED